MKDYILDTVNVVLIILVPKEVLRENLYFMTSIKLLIFFLLYNVSGGFGD